MRIDTFRMERMQCLYEHHVDYNLSESGVLPMSVGEVLEGSDPSEFMASQLFYPESDGSPALRERIAAWYPGATPANVTVMNGGSEANHIALWTLLEPGDRLACMVPNYMQAWGLGRHYGSGSDAFRLRVKEQGGVKRWALDEEGLGRAVTKRTRVVLVTNPNNPTGGVLTEDEMEAVVAAARWAGAWIVADEIYRGAEIQGDGPAATSPTFWGRYEKTLITSGLSKAFGLPGLRVGWAVAPPRTIEKLWQHHDYTTLTPGYLSNRLGERVMEPSRREAVLARTRSIIRQNLPRLESWITAQGDALSYVRPVAGAIAFLKHRSPARSSTLADRMRKERSVLVVPGDQLGMSRYFRVGFGYDMEHTLKGLARIEKMLKLPLTRG